MEQVKVILEKTNTGYSAYSPDINGCIAVGDSLSDVKKGFTEAVEFHLEGLVEDEDPIPEVLQGDYRLMFKIDMPAFFEWMSGIMTKSGIAQIAGLNRDLVNHYANGQKKPSQRQLLKIETAIHNLGNELLSISF